jgi:O-acetyl-ADP-ribose deacetylase (regulator of RNase III)
MHVFATGNVVGPRFIINFPTKRHWKAASRMDDIEAGLPALVEAITQHGIRTIAIPPLGCGNGGLRWSDVMPRIVDALQMLDPAVRVVIYEPSDEPVGAARVAAPLPPRLTAAKSVLLALMHRYRLADLSLAQIEVQKLTYFLQVAGQDLKLHFKPAKFGPYAHNLNHVLRDLEGHFLDGAINTAPFTEITFRAGAADAAMDVIRDDTAALEHLERVSQLVEGFETPYGMELLATVHWTMRYHPEAVTDPDACVRLVHGWGARKKHLMKPRHIEIARQRLLAAAWSTPTHPN